MIFKADDCPSRRVSFARRWVRSLPLYALLGGGCAALWFFQSPERHYRRAIAALDDNRLEPVAYELLGVVSEPSLEAQAALLSGHLLAARGEPKAALQEAALAITSPETKIRAMVLLGACLYKSDQFLEAGETWSKVLALDPDNVDAHRWLGAAYYELGAVRDALAHLRRAAELRPHDPGPHRLIGRLCVEFWEPKTAIEAFQEALRRAPNRSDNDDVRFSLAKVFYQTSRQREALELLSRCERTANVVALMAECEHGLGNGEQAWSLLNDALGLDREHVRALGLKGKLLIERRRFQDAAQALETAAGLAPKDTTVLYDLAIAYQRVGQLEKAKQMHRLVDRLRQFQRTYDDLIFEAVGDPRDAQIRARLGMLAAQLDKPSQAEKWFQASVRLDPGNAESRAALQRLRSPYQVDRELH